MTPKGLTEEEEEEEEKHVQVSRKWSLKNYWIKNIS